VESGRGVALVPDSMACLTGQRLKLLKLTPEPRPIIVGALLAEGERVARGATFHRCGGGGSPGETYSRVTDSAAFAAEDGNAMFVRECGELLTFRAEASFLPRPAEHADGRASRAGLAG